MYWTQSIYCPKCKTHTTHRLDEVVVTEGHAVVEDRNDWTARTASVSCIATCTECNERGPGGMVNPAVTITRTYT